MSLYPTSNTSHQPYPNGWQIINGKLCKKFIFKDFIQALAFMQQTAVYIESINHHPEWENIYNTLNVKLITHEAKAITSLDLQLADYLNEAFTNINY